MSVAERDLAVEVAAEAGALALDYHARGVLPEWKGVGDVVTAADRAVEDLIRDRIAAAFPGDLVVGEEGRGVQESEVGGRRRWYVDPIDGTTNFLKGREWWAVSLGFCDADDTMAAGCVRMPVLELSYAAARGQGATRDGQAIHASSVTGLEQALCSSGFPGAAVRADAAEDNVAIWQAVMRRALSLRATGAIAPDLCAVADGRCDGSWTLGVERWDLAAGCLIAAEAGAVVTDLAGSPIAGPAWAAVVAAPGIHAALLDLVATHRR